jgi:2-desacetyl-2-hydroxyethyl bacteriochlorophyllide A dehydrogenase
MDLQTETMLCGVCVDVGRFEVQERPLPQVAPEGWVLVDLAAAGLCGTDYHIFEGKHPYLEYPRVIGHELSGFVAQTAHGFTAGQVVVVNPYISCGECRACLRGKPNCCVAIGVLGVHRDGGMCARIAVPAGNLYDAQGLSPRHAALVEFLAIGAHAVRRSDMAAGDRVLVVGAGPIGLGAALFARMTGAEVHVMDLSPERLAAAARLGFAQLHGAAAVLPKDGFDVVMDATGNPRAMEAGFGRVAHGGTYVLVSVVKDDLSFNDAEFHKREMRLIGSRNALAEDFAHVIKALKFGDISGDALISTVLPLADLPRRIGELAADRGGIIKAIVSLREGA